MEEKEWFRVSNISGVDSPALLVYKDRAIENIKTLLHTIDRVDRLRPHIKTHKSAEIAGIMMDHGIRKFKCATIAEAEMLAQAGAPDVLLAYQPVGPKAHRFEALVRNFTNTSFSCLIDNIDAASYLASAFQSAAHPPDVFIDLNVGMSRTGISPAAAHELFEECQKLRLSIRGLHAYDGHIRDTDYAVRKQKCDEAFAPVQKLKTDIDTNFKTDHIIVAGGTPTYSIHCKRIDIECSPGTFIYWDKGYQQILPEQQYQFAALVLTRVISKPTSDIICVDLGHKSIASENPLNNRVYFLNAPELEPIGHSEEHMVLRCHGSTYSIGDTLYGVPHHICPTVALHDQVAVIEGHVQTQYWETISRNRKITI